MKIKFFILTCMLMLSTVAAQFRFGLNLLNYTPVLNNNFGKNVVRHTWFPSLEFGGLFMENYEVGVSLNSGLGIKANINQLIQGENLGDVGVYLSLGISPYFRYYFGKNPEVRPYLIASPGFVYHGFISANNADGSLALNPSFTARTGLGIKLAKFVDLYVTYRYGGILTVNTISPLLGNITTDNKHMHALDVGMSFSFGGNIKK